MEIYFSRHAQRRIKLYAIDEDDVISSIKNWVGKQSIIQNRNSIIVNELKQKYHFPIKIVFSFEGSKIVVITAYPLKKGKQI